MPGSRIVQTVRHWIYRNAYLLTLLAPLFLLASVELWARAGGGGSYSSGSRSYGSSRSGGRSGGGGGGEDIIIRLLIELVIRYPAVGIPVVIGVCVFVYYSSKEGKEVYVDYTIRKGMRAQKDSLRQAALQALKKRDPQFTEDAFLKRVERAFLKVQKAWCDHNLPLAQAFLSDGVLERFGLQIKEQIDKGVRDRMENIQVLERRVAQIQSDAHFDTIHVYVRASAIDYQEDLKTKKPVGAKKGDEEFEEYWSFLRKPSAKSLSVKGGLIEGVCPNCGAPLEVSATVKCPYCQALLRSGEYDWVLAEITQACEWAVQETRQ
ncbi:MAG TPA: transporter, partial [Candidatus Ozemobacteraceae bacterium]|nr:transporter [Candidatus Ozemobacteraceae bacterium]